MKRVWVAATILAVCGTAGAQVYRCEIKGKISYSDAPCGSGAMRSVEVEGNLVERVPAPQTAGTGTGTLQAGAVPGACPTDLDLQNIDTRLSGHVVPAKNRTALHYERAKALRCRTLGARYEDDDWRRLAGVLRGEE